MIQSLVKVMTVAMMVMKVVTAVTSPRSPREAKERAEDTRRQSSMSLPLSFRPSTQSLKLLASQLLLLAQARCLARMDRPLLTVALRDPLALLALVDRLRMVAPQVDRAARDQSR